MTAEKIPTMCKSFIVVCKVAESHDFIVLNGSHSPADVIFDNVC